MRICFCNLCGTPLPRTQWAYDIVDTRDRYKHYHHKHWDVCDVCHEELEERRKKVLEDIKKNDGNMIELD